MMVRMRECAKGGTAAGAGRTGNVGWRGHTNSNGRVVYPALDAVFSPEPAVTLELQAC